MSNSLAPVIRKKKRAIIVISPTLSCGQILTVLSPVYQLFLLLVPPSQPAKSNPALCRRPASYGRENKSLGSFCSRIVHQEKASILYPSETRMKFNISSPGVAGCPAPWSAFQLAKEALAYSCALAHWPNNCGNDKGYGNKKPKEFTKRSFSISIPNKSLKA